MSEETAPEAAVLPVRPLWLLRGKRALIGFALAAALGGMAAVVNANDATLAGLWIGVGAMAAAVCAALLGAQALWTMYRTTEPVPVAMVAGLGLLTFAVGGTVAFIGALIALFAVSGFGRGRQLRRFGKVLLPRLRGGNGFTRVALEVEAPEDLCAPLAEQWRENGRTEHASVAAFARLQLDLLALGAPPELLHAACRDQRDEIRHTELCFSLARALDGEAIGPGPFPEPQRARTLSAIRALALVQLAVDSLVDGALHEGVSARVIARLVKRCEVARIQEVLREIAADEGRHAAHGWEVVEWCLEEGGASVARALRGAVEALSLAKLDPRPEGAREGAWERFGIHGAPLERDEHHKACAEIARRVARMTAPHLGEKLEEAELSRAG